MRIKFSGTGFTAIPNQLVDLWPRLRVMRIPVVLCGEKVTAQLIPTDRIIFEVLFRFAYAGRMNVRRGLREIARLADLGERQLRDRLYVLEAAGMIAIVRSPGKPSEIDLDGLMGFLNRFQAPPLPPVEKCADLFTTPEVDLRGQEGDFSLWNSPEVESEQGDRAGEGGANPGDNKQRTTEKDFVESKSNRWNSRENPRESPQSPSRKSSNAGFTSASLDPPTNPPGKSNGSGREERRTPAIADVLEDPRIPRDVRTRREATLSHFPDAMRRQAIETIVRTELRLFGIKSSAIHRFFQTVPLDGMVWWINQAWSKAKRNKGGFVVTVFDRTGGAIPKDAA